MRHFQTRRRASNIAPQPKAASPVWSMIAIAQAYTLGSAALALFLFTLVAHSAETSANWPQFRGPGAMGVADHPGLPERWSTNENVAWKIDVAGRGWSSPIVWGN